MENVKQPDDYIPELLSRVRPEYIRRTYELDHWEDSVDFLTQLAKRTGKLIKGGEADLGSVAKMVLNDWLRGKIPYYTPPPEGDKPGGESDIKEEEVAVDSNVNQSVPHVDQIFSKIPVMQKFMADDLANNALLIEEERNKQESNHPEGVLPDEADDDDDINRKDDGSEDAKPSTAAKARMNKAELRKDKKSRKEAKPPASGAVSEGKLDWDDVFANVVGETVDSIPGKEEANVDSELELSDEEAERKQRIKQRAGLKRASKGPAGFEVKDVVKKPEKSSKRKSIEDDDEDEEAKPVKEARMTTNKGKIGTHYYETANVKNKNRNKATPQDPKKLATKLRDQGKKRRH